MRLKLNVSISYMDIWDEYQKKNNNGQNAIIRIDKKQKINRII